MKRFALPSMAILIGVAIALTSTSCIYEAPGDLFYRTLWESDEDSSAPSEIDSITLEFLCENAITLKTGNSSIVNYGTYDSNSRTAVFHDLTLEIEGDTITFIDAYRTDNNLLLRWRYGGNSSETFTTSMHRLSAYK